MFIHANNTFITKVTEEAQFDGHIHQNDIDIHPFDPCSQADREATDRST